MKRLFLFLLLLLTGSVYSAHAQEIAIVTENYPPYHYEHNGVVVGQGAETVQGSTKKNQSRWNLRSNIVQIRSVKT